MLRRMIQKVISSCSSIGSVNGAKNWKKDGQKQERVAESKLEIEVPRCVSACEG